MRSAVVLVLLILLAAPALRAQDQAALKKQMLELERAVNNTLRQGVDARPFAMLEEPKSAYLEGFGVVIHAEVNLYPTSPLLGFASQDHQDRELKGERDQKVRRLRLLQEQLRELLAAQAAALTQLGPDANLAIVIHLFNVRPFPEIPSQVVLQARRQALLQFQGRKAEPADLAKVITLRSF